MLANFRRDDRVTALRRLVKRSNGPLRQDFLAALAKIQRSARTPAFDPAPPFGLVRLLVALALPERDHAGHDTAHITNNRKVNDDIIVDQTAIDIDVNLLDVWRDSNQQASDAIIEQLDTERTNIG